MEDCKTKFPLMLVHGAGYRDDGSHYWGEVPSVLREHGAIVFFSGHDEWGTLETCARQIKQALKTACQTSGSPQVNVIAHSKGGLDLRYLLRKYPREKERIASFTSICVPHRGSATMSKLLQLPSPLWRSFSRFRNFMARRSGDQNPDFYAACQQLTKEYWEAFEKDASFPQDIPCPCYAAILKTVRQSVLLTVPRFVVRRFEGENDGLVSLSSASWGTVTTVVPGVSHADMADFYRRKSKQQRVNAVYLDAVRQLRGWGL